MSIAITSQPDAKGHFGPYGGVFVPETLMTALEELTIPSGGSLTGLGDDGLHGLVSLKYLSLGCFDALEGLEDIRALPRLELLSIFRSGIRSLEGMGVLPQLQRLDVQQCGSLTTLMGIAMLPRLEELNITECSALADVKGMEGCPRLRDVRVTGDGLKSLDGLRNLPSLEELYVRAEALVHLGDLEGLPVLGDVWLYACTALHRYDSLRALPKLKRLHLNESSHLKSLKAFRELAGLKLESLDLCWCRALSSLDGIESLTTLQELDLRGCERVTKFAPIANLRALKTVNLTESGASWDHRRALSGPVLTAFLTELRTK
jgi:Leucine-rich repeat (LRR) protein